MPLVVRYTYIFNFFAGMTTKTDKLQSRNKFRSLVGVLSEGRVTPSPRIQSLSPLPSQTVRGGAGSGTEGLKNHMVIVILSGSLRA